MGVTGPRPARIRSRTALKSVAVPSPPTASPLDDVLASVLEVLARTAPDGSRGPEVLDCGGGSGSRAVPLAVRGAQVTVVDASIDALAILARRAAEAGVPERVRGVQADVENLSKTADPGSADLVLVHGVLGSIRDPAQVLNAAANAVRGGGYLSVVVPNPVAAVLARAFAGELSVALADLEAAQTDAPDRPLDLDALRALVRAAGLDVELTQGLGAFSSTLPGSVLDAQLGTRATLAALDRRAAELSPYREIAGQLHLLARRPVAGPQETRWAGAEQDEAGPDGAGPAEAGSGVSRLPGTGSHGT